MIKITYEMANTWLNELLQEGAFPESSSHPEESILWADFVELISRYCRYRGWEAISDGLSCMIYAQHDAEENHAETCQGRFSFERDFDDLPF